MAEIYEAFWTMSRPIGSGGVGLVPESEIAAWLDLRCVTDQDERVCMSEAIHAMDVEYVQAMNRREKE